MIVVAGAAGKTGSSVAEALLEQGQAVRVLTRQPRVAAAWQARGAEASVVGLDDGAALTRALRGAEALYMLLPEDFAAEEMPKLRRRMVDAVASALRANAVPRVVLLSALAAVVSDGNGPARELHYAERVLQTATSHLTTLRACYFQENVLSGLQPALRDGVFPSFFPSGSGAVPMVAARDVGKLAAECLLKPARASEIIDVLGPAYSVQEAAEKLGKALGGRTLRVVEVPASEHVAALMRAGLPAQAAASIAELYGCLASGRAAPAGQRTLLGTTPLETTLALALTAH